LSRSICTARVSSSIARARSPNIPQAAAIWVVDDQLRAAARRRQRLRQRGDRTRVAVHRRGHATQLVDGLAGAPELDKRVAVPEMADREVRRPVRAARRHVDPPLPGCAPRSTRGPASASSYRGSRSASTRIAISPTHSHVNTAAHRRDCSDPYHDAAGSNTRDPGKSTRIFDEPGGPVMARVFQQFVPAARCSTTSSRSSDRCDRAAVDAMMFLMAT
jgi:hypothetical protein